MLIKKLRKQLNPAVYCLLPAVLFFPVRSAAGWLLWEAPAYIAGAPGEKELRSADMALATVPVKAQLEGKPDIELELDAVFEAGAGNLRILFGNAGFEETSYEFKKSFFGALTQLFSGNAPSKFPPAPKWLNGSRPQDLSFIRLQEGGRQGVYLWRLPFRTKKAPLWAAGLWSPEGERGWLRPLETAPPASQQKQRGWALITEKDKKIRALKIRARRTGKTCFIFTLP